MYRTILRFTLGLLTLLTLAACGAAAQPVAQTDTTPVVSSAPPSTVKPKIGANATLLTIRSDGGMCMNGGCWSEQQIKVDGSFTTTDSTGTTRNGTLDVTKVAELTEQIAATDFEHLKAQPFTGTCPVAFDGQEHTYTFQTMSGPQTIASCKVAIDQNSSLFQTIAGLSAEMNKE